MGVIASGVIWGIAVGVVMVLVNLLLKKKEKVGAVLFEMTSSFIGMLVFVLLFKAAGEQQLLAVDLNNVDHVLVFLIVFPILERFTRVVIVARLL